MSNLLVILDVIVVVLNVIFFKELEIGLYSAITIYVMGKVLDLLFEGIDFAKMVFVISPEYERMAKKISKNIKRGSTLFYGKGMYKDEERNVLMCVASRGEVRQILRNSKDYRQKCIYNNNKCKRSIRKRL